eukprot:3225365-Prymnesium_polylepis.1
MPQPTRFCAHADVVYVMSLWTSFVPTPISSPNEIGIVLPVDQRWIGTVKTVAFTASAGRPASVVGVPHWWRTNTPPIFRLRSTLYVLWYSMLKSFAYWTVSCTISPAENSARRSTGK